MKYEYKLISVGGNPWQIQQELLNDAGGEGWRMVGVIGAAAVMMREKSSPPSSDTKRKSRT